MLVRALMLATAFGMLALPARAQDGATRALDPVRSRATFSVAHLYVARVTGSVPIVSGEVALAPDSPLPTALDAVLDPKRIASGNGDRDDDLQGPDWFDTKRFGTWAFHSTAITATSATAFVVSGTLTVRGIAQPMTLEVTTVRVLPHPAYRAVGHLDRHGFGMPRTPADGLIGTDVTVVLEVELR